jgi:hypothetical protein
MPDPDIEVFGDRVKVPVSVGSLKNAYVRVSFFPPKGAGSLSEINKGNRFARPGGISYVGSERFNFNASDAYHLPDAEFVTGFEVDVPTDGSVWSASLSLFDHTKSGELETVFALVGNMFAVGVTIGFHDDVKSEKRYVGIIGGINLHLTPQGVGYVVSILSDALFEGRAKSLAFASGSSGLRALSTFYRAFGVEDKSQRDADGALLKDSNGKTIPPRRTVGVIPVWAPFMYAAALCGWDLNGRPGPQSTRLSSQVLETIIRLDADASIFLDTFKPGSPFFAGATSLEVSDVRFDADNAVNVAPDNGETVVAWVNRLVSATGMVNASGRPYRFYFDTVDGREVAFFHTEDWNPRKGQAYARVGASPPSAAKGPVTVSTARTNAQNAAKLQTGPVLEFREEDSAATFVYGSNAMGSVIDFTINDAALSTAFLLGWNGGEFVAPDTRTGEYMRFALEASGVIRAASDKYNSLDATSENQIRAADSAVVDEVQKLRPQAYLDLGRSLRSRFPREIEMGKGGVQTADITGSINQFIARLARFHFQARTQAVSGTLTVVGNAAIRAFDLVTIKYILQNSNPSYISGVYRVLSVKHRIDSGSGWITTMDVFKNLPITKDTPGTVAAAEKS